MNPRKNKSSGRESPRQVELNTLNTVLQEKFDQLNRDLELKHIQVDKLHDQAAELRESIIEVRSNINETRRVKKELLESLTQESEEKKLTLFRKSSKNKRNRQKGRSERKLEKELNENLRLAHGQVVDLQEGIEAFLKKSRGHAQTVHFELVDPSFVNLNATSVIEFKKIKTPVVSIIIPVYNQVEYTYACLKSIKENLHDATPFEIIVIDDCSPNQEARDLKGLIKNIQFIQNAKNLGFLRSCNKAAEKANGEFVLFLNNDTNVQSNWLDSLVELIQSDNKIGMVGSKLVYPDGSLQEAGGIVWKDASGWNYGRGNDPSNPEYNYVKEVDYISGASILVRKNLWQELGGFDERYVPAYYEDSDLAFAIRKKGFKVNYQPNSVVVHYEGISNGTDVEGSGIKNYQLKNRVKFEKKWKKELTSQFENGKNVFQARERSAGKKQILVIDHYVPHFDQDAGSRSLFSYLKFFIAKGFQVKFIGDNFHPTQPYTNIMQDLGIEILHGKEYRTKWKLWIEENGQYLDYIFLSRPHVAVKYIDFIRPLTNAKIAYYGHDLHYLREQREFVVTGKPEHKEMSEKWKEIEFSLMQKADVSYYFSSNEIEEIKKIDALINAQTLPLYLFTKFEEKKRKVPETSNLMFVGGFSHRPNVDGIVWFMNEIWPEVSKAIPASKLFIVGSKPTDKVSGFSDERVTVTGYVSDDDLRDLYANVRMVVVPLRYGAGVKGKVVEALHNQVPLITTSVGAEGLPDAEKHMIIADESHDFTNELVKSYNDVILLESLSRNGKSYCEKNFSFQKAQESLSETIDFGS